jgi:hypothetical protein
MPAPRRSATGAQGREAQQQRHTGTFREGPQRTPSDGPLEVPLPSGSTMHEFANVI